MNRFPALCLVALAVSAPWWLRASPTGTGHLLVSNHSVYPYVVDNDVVQAEMYDINLYWVKTDGSAWHCVLTSSGPSASEKMTEIAAADEIHVQSENRYYLTSGLLSGMGSNACGQLGQGSTATTYYALPVTIDTNVQSVYPTQNRIVYLKKDGSLWGVGDNAFGQLGNGTVSASESVGTNLITSPFEIDPGPVSKVWATVGYTEDALFYLKGNKLYACGNLTFLFTSPAAPGYSPTYTPSPVLLASSVAEFVGLMGSSYDGVSMYYLSTDKKLMFMGGKNDDSIGSPLAYGETYAGWIGLQFAIADNVTSAQMDKNGVYCVKTTGELDYYAQASGGVHERLLASGAAKLSLGNFLLDSANTMNLVLSDKGAVLGYGSNLGNSFGSSYVFGSSRDITNAIKLGTGVDSIVANGSRNGGVWAFLADANPVPLDKWDRLADSWGLRYTGNAPWYYSYLYKFWYYEYPGGYAEYHADGDWGAYWIFFYTSDFSDCGWGYCYTKWGWSCYKDGVWTWLWWGDPLP